jgi:hypothetical protein
LMRKLGKKVERMGGKKTNLLGGFLLLRPPSEMIRPS